MWSQSLFDHLYALLRPAGILTTYCAKGVIRRMLQSSGSTWNVFRDLRVGNVRFCVQVRLNPVLKKAFQVLKKRFGVHEKRLRCFDEKTSTFSRRTFYQFFIFTLPPFREKTFKVFSLSSEMFLKIFFAFVKSTQNYCKSIHIFTICRFCR